MSATNAVCLIGVLLAFQAAGDLPVHCLRHEVEGEWKFVLGPVSKTRTACGHLHPDIEEGQPARNVIKGPTSVQQFTLHNPSTVSTPSGKKGTWTMVYDEGFEVNVDGRSFFAFSNFTFQKDPVTHLKKNFSHCGDTMVGWYQNTQRTEFGCYYGSKVAPTLPKALPAVQGSKSAGYDTAVTHKAMKQKVDKLNRKLAMLQLGWRARVMKKWVGKTPREINSYAGIRRIAQMRDMHREMLRQSLANKQHASRSFLQRDTPVPKLPESFDWSNTEDGIDWLEPVMDQSDCGSCYAASTMRMLSVRHKIKTRNESALPWSINMPLFCGEYNQGCKGGYPFLMSKWSSDVGLVPATCMRYNTAGTCKLECDLEKDVDKWYKAANHRYIGDFYGNDSAKAMMQELVRNGPVTVAFEPAEDFMLYSDGIYRSQGADTRNKAPQEWEKVDHAVLLVGYGEENGTKYWKVQNSWGPDWGEDGFFRMIRGVDESAIESVAHVADVVEDEQEGRQVKALFAQLNKNQ